MPRLSGIDLGVFRAVGTTTSAELFKGGELTIAGAAVDTRVFEWDRLGWTGACAGPLSVPARSLWLDDDLLGCDWGATAACA